VLKLVPNIIRKINWIDRFYTFSNFS